jgi:hypothetical protein
LFSGAPSRDASAHDGVVESGETQAKDLGFRLHPIVLHSIVLLFRHRMVCVVTDVRALDPEDHVFGDVGGVVGNALQVA